MSVDRSQWLQHLQDVLRSRHYTWLPEGLGGESVEVAMSYLLTDIRHICKMSDVSFDDVLTESRQRYVREESRVDMAEVSTDE